MKNDPPTSTGSDASAVANKVDAAQLAGSIPSTTDAAADTAAKGKDNEQAAKPIAALVGQSDQKLEKVVLNALSNIADPASETVLAQAAEKVGFAYDNTNATSSY